MPDPIPTAVARGPEAASRTAVSPMRAGIVFGALAAAFVFVIYVLSPVPARALSIVGADGDGVGRYGGLRLVWVPPPGADVGTIQRTMASREGAARVERDGEALIIEIPGVTREEGAQTAKLIVAGGVNFHRTRIAPEMTELARPPYDVPFPQKLDLSLGPQLAIDQWQPEDGGPRRTDYYLAAGTREELDAVIAHVHDAGWRLPAGTHLAYARVDPRPSYRDHRDIEPGYWRSHVIEDAPALSGMHVAKAVPSHDPNTNRPIVLLDFDREGGRIFGELTAEIVGEKLATVLGGDVVSAPIINAAIRGGRASITMGGSDVVSQERERDALVGVLVSGPLPPGGELRRADYLAPSNSAASEWLARLVLALGAGLFVGLCAWMVVRKARPVWRSPDVRLPGRIAWERLAILLVAPIVLYVASMVTAPGLDTDTLIYVFRDDSQFSIGMLGIGPLITSYIVVELVAMIVPPLRRRRHAGPLARQPLDVAVLVGAGLLSILQSWFVASYIAHVDDSASAVNLAVFLPAMVGMTMAFAGVAALVRRYSFGTGLVVITCAGYLLHLVHTFVPMDTAWDRPGVATTPQIVLAIVALVMFSIIAVLLLRLRISRIGEVPLRVPTSGHAPIYEAAGVIAIAMGLLELFSISPTWAHDAYLWSVDLGRWIAFVLVAAFCVLWSWVFARPKVLAGFAERAKLAPPSLEAWRAATLLSIAMLLAITSGYTALRAAPGAMTGTVEIVLLAALALDILDDLRGRRGKTVRAWSLHSAQHADLAGHVLDDAKIAFHLSGANVRTMLAWFGPFAPIDVHVRSEDVARTRELLANVFAPK